MICLIFIPRPFPKFLCSTSIYSIATNLVEVILAQPQML